MRQDDDFALPTPGGFEDGPTGRSPAAASRMRTLVLLAVLGLLAAVGYDQFRRFRKENPQLLTQIWDELTGNSPRATAQRLFDALRDGNPEKALREADRLKQMLPKDTSVRYQRAEILAAMGDYAGSIAEYTEVIAEFGDQPTALNNRAYNRALARIEIREAMADVQRALEIEPGNAAFIDTLGYLHYLAGDFDKALAEFDRIFVDNNVYGLERGPGAGEIFFHRALVHQQLGNDAEAERDLDRARRLGYRELTPIPPLSDEERQQAGLPVRGTAAESL